MSASWTGTDNHTWRGETTATLRSPQREDDAGNAVAAVLTMSSTEYGGEVMRLTVEELRELAMVATALASLKEAKR